MKIYIPSIVHKCDNNVFGLEFHIFEEPISITQPNAGLGSSSSSIYDNGRYALRNTAIVLCRLHIQFGLAILHILVGVGKEPTSEHAIGRY